jgi:hypothetical protein
MRLAQIQESENHEKIRGEKSQAFAHSSTEENGRTGEGKRREGKKSEQGRRQADGITANSMWREEIEPTGFRSSTVKTTQCNVLFPFFYRQEQQAIGRRKRQQCHSGGGSVRNYILWTLHWNFRFDVPGMERIFYGQFTGTFVLMGQTRNVWALGPFYSSR